MSLLSRTRAEPGDTLGSVPFSRISGVVVIALLGLVLAAAITYAASTLVSQPIGLTSEPATLGKGLAPSATGSGTPTQTITVTTTSPTTATQGVTPPATAGDDHGGRSDGDGDDD